jgi:hypothetical protein
VTLFFTPQGRPVIAVMGNSLIVAADWFFAVGTLFLCNHEVDLSDIKRFMFLVRHWFFAQKNKIFFFDIQTIFRVLDLFHSLRRTALEKYCHRL